MLITQRLSSTPTMSSNAPQSTQDQTLRHGRSEKSEKWQNIPAFTNTIPIALLYVVSVQSPGQVIKRLSRQFWEICICNLYRICYMFSTDNSVLHLFCIPGSLDDCMLYLLHLVFSACLKNRILRCVACFCFYIAQCPHNPTAWWSHF